MVLWHQIYSKMPTQIVERKLTFATIQATHFDYQQVFLYTHHPTDRIAHTFGTPFVEHWMK